MDDKTLEKLIETAQERAHGNQSSNPGSNAEPPYFFANSELPEEKKLIIDKKFKRPNLLKAEDIEPRVKDLKGDFPAYYEKKFPKDEGVRREIRKQLDEIKSRQKIDEKMRPSDFKSNLEIVPETG